MSQHLTVDDFGITKTEKGNVLSIKNLNGITLVVFYAKSCPLCGHLIPELSAAIQNEYRNYRVLFVDVLKNKSIIEMSKKTIVEIKEVPLIIIYDKNGTPLIKYTGDKRNINLIFNTYNDIIQRLNEKRTFFNGQQQPQYQTQPQQARLQQFQQSKKQLRQTGLAETHLVNGVMPYNVVCDSEDVCYIVTPNCGGGSCTI